MSSHDRLPFGSWRSLREAVAIVTEPSNLRKTTLLAIVVGTVLFGINQLDVVARGEATTAVWVKVGVTYLVPFCVSNAGVLIGTHRH